MRRLEAQEIKLGSVQATIEMIIRDNLQMQNKNDTQEFQNKIILDILQMCDWRSPNISPSCATDLQGESCHWVNEPTVNKYLLKSDDSVKNSFYP